MAELGVLGPVLMCVGGRPVDLGPPKQRAVLAALALDANQPVPVPALVERTWDQPPPAVITLCLRSAGTPTPRRQCRAATGYAHPYVSVLAEGPEARSNCTPSWVRS